MKRDWDVVRDVLSQVEAIPPEKRASLVFAAEDDGDLCEVEHAILLCETGFIDGKVVRVLSGPPRLLVLGLTWQGHELLDTIRSKAVWERVKTLAREKGIDLTIDSVKVLAGLALKSLIGP